MTGTDNGHDSGGWKQHYFFSAWRSGTGGYEALSTPRGTSSAFCTPVEICGHLQHAGTRHGGSQAHTAVLEPPQSQCTRIDGAVAMNGPFPFAPPCTSVASAEFQLSVGDSDPYHMSQRTWAPSTLALVKVPELQEPAIGTSHELFPVWFLTKCTFSAFTPLSLRSESGSQATYKRAEINLHVSAFGIDT